ADPQIKGVIINARDIGARKRAEQALRESESRYRNLIEKSHSLICTHDMEGRLLSVNPAAATSLGYEPAEMVGRNLADFSHPGTQANLPKYMELMATVGQDAGDMRVADRSGQVHVWAYNNVRIDEPGRPPYVLGHAIDITALTRVQEALLASETRY